MNKPNGIVQKVTYVAGQPVHKMGETDTINQIKFLQEKKRTLESIGVKSTRVSEKIADLEEGIVTLVAHLDKGLDAQHNGDPSDNHGPE